MDKDNSWKLKTVEELRSSFVDALEKYTAEHEVSTIEGLTATIQLTIELVTSQFPKIPTSTKMEAGRIVGNAMLEIINDFGNYLESLLNPDGTFNECNQSDTNEDDLYR